MACPWFSPTRPLEDARWAVPPRLPLIDAWDGECRSTASGPAPDNETIRARCNSGYARGACARFADGRGDAVRFHIQPNETGPLRILYSYERDCWPTGHGVIEYDAAQQRASADDELLARQAEAFAISYLKRTGAAV